MVEGFVANVMCHVIFFGCSASLELVSQKVSVIAFKGESGSCLSWDGQAIECPVVLFIRGDGT